MTLPPAGTRGYVIPPIARPFYKAAMRASNSIARRLGDRMKAQGRQLILLTTVGAKSGQDRQTGLARFDDPEHPGSWLVVGSNAGSARHPAWAYNLVAHPDRVRVRVGGNELAVHASLLNPAERERAWDMVVSLAPGYARYEQKQIDKSHLPSDSALNGSGALERPLESIED
ncbi:MAG: nitroreductase family deazaflavin-dependent oxidoreductase [Actinomycetota bacterium]|nr:nitroreductase family deazaflavin-dependent oxidoreductase [Actinomycetota bacterium]